MFIYLGIRTQDIDYLHFYSISTFETLCIDTASSFNSCTERVCNCRVLIDFLTYTAPVKKRPAIVKHTEKLIKRILKPPLLPYLMTNIGIHNYQLTENCESHSCSTCNLGIRCMNFIFNYNSNYFRFK